MKKRCSWVSPDNELYEKYHDEEWGVPLHDDKKLFELLVLEGAQAGLSWLIVLRKRENYRKAFDGFDFEKIAKYDVRKEKELLQDKGIVRNRLKISSAIRNAKVFIEIRKEFGSFDKYIWGFSDGKIIKKKWKSWREMPASSELSDEISKNLKRRGMNFIGSTIIYAYMQSIGMVNDHEVGCFRYGEV